MNGLMDDFFFFGVLPYVSLAIFFLVTIRRYRIRTFSYSSLSSQFLENRQHFWGSVPFHYGILLVLAGHLLGLLLPRGVLWWNAAPMRLAFLEITGLAFGLLTLIGLLVIAVRRWTNPKVRRVTTISDWVVYFLLLAQVVTGVLVAVHAGWGSSWFATNLTPWLWSLVTLTPQIDFIAPLPWLVKLHIINAFVLIGFFPFTRLVHVLVVPNPYLWRKTQVVRWNWDRKRLRDPN
jgi:nitrate reductase gamma subunit